MALIPGTSDMETQETAPTPIGGSAALWASLMSVARSGLNALGYMEWAVLRNYNPATENKNPPFIAVQRLSAVVNPWVSGRDIATTRDGTEKFLHVESVAENTTFRLSAFRNTDLFDESQGAEAWDVLCDLRLWLFSDAGISALRENSIYPLRCGNVSEPAVMTSNGVFEFMPSFDLTVQTIRETEMEQNLFVSAGGEKIKGV